MSFEITRQELTKQANDLLKLYRQTRDQKYKDQENRLRRIVTELSNFTGGGSGSGVSQIVAGTNVTISPTGGTGVVTVNATTGAATNGLPVGGTAGQILAKIDSTNYNTEWIDNYTSQIKHEVKLGETMTAGTPVYVSGTTGGSGTNMIVRKASNASEMTSSKTMGLIATGGVTNDFVFVITEGLLAGLNTGTATAGDPVWLGPSGTLLFGLANKPVAPAHMVFLGIVTRAHAVNGEIFVKVQNGFELDELHDVLIQSKANNDLLVYESSTSLWKNKTISAIFGGTPLVSVPTLAQVTTAGATTTNAISVGGLTVATNLIYSNTVNSRVGIGTASPSEKLHVSGGNILFDNNYNLRSFTSLGGVSNVFGTTTANELLFGSGNWTLIRFDVGGAAARMSITSNGNVLINTTTDAGYKLDVNGTARISSNLTVDTNTLFVDATNDRVGFGTTTPAYRVDVRGTTLVDSVVSAEGGFNISRVAAPTGTITLTPSAGGSVDVGQHYYFITYTTAIGETNKGSNAGIVITAGSQTVTITGIPISTDPRVTGRKIYRTRAGQTSDRGVLVATIANNTTTTYVDSVADSTLTNIGDFASYRENTTSRYIMVDGTRAMLLGSNVTAIGIGAGANITEAGLTVLIGTNAGQNLTSGFNNTFIGSLAGRFVNTGGSNVALSSYCLMNTTTGNANIAIGPNSLWYNITGSDNIAIGYGALSGVSGSSHSRNIAIGRSSLAALGAAGDNVAIGASAGRYISTGASNTLSSNSLFIGYNTQPNADGETNQIVIGYNSVGLGSNTTVLGNSSTTFTSIPAGNMTIGGTVNAGYKLDVQGTIRSTGVITASGGTSTNWNTAYGWGDHSAAGYALAFMGYTGSFSVPTNPPGQQTLDIQNGIIVNVF